MNPEINDRILSVLPTLEGWCWPEKAISLANFILGNKPKVIVEIGIFGGKSAIPMAIAAREVGAIVYAFDPWSKDEALAGDHSPVDSDWWAKLDYASIYKGFVESVIRYGLLEYLHWFRMTGDQAKRHFDRVDFLHIDGNHSELRSVQDVEDWLPKVPKGGIIVFDDIAWPTTEKAVAILDARCECLSKVAVEQGSYGVWKKL